MHARISHGIGTLADSVDSFFVDDRIDEEFNRTRVRVRVGPRVELREGFELTHSVSLNLDLPQIEHATLVFTSFEETEDVDEVDTVDGEDDGIAMALRYFLIDRRWFRAHLDGGVRFKPELDPYASLRATHATVIPGEILVRPTQFLYVEQRDGFGETTRLDLERRLDESLALMRLRSEATVAESQSGVRLRSALGYSRVLNERAGIRLEAALRARTSPAAVVREYRLSARWRQLAHDRWLFVELEPFVRFGREHGFDPTPGVALRLEIQFGERLIGSSPAAAALE